MLNNLKNIIFPKLILKFLERKKNNSVFGLLSTFK